MVKALASQRVKFTPQHVYNVKATSGKRPRMDQLRALIEAKKFADKLGGIDRAREALNALAKLL